MIKAFQDPKTKEAEDVQAMFEADADDFASKFASHIEE